MRTKIFYSIIILFLISPISSIFLKSNTFTQAQVVQYISPAPGSKYNPIFTTIAIRYADLIDQNSISNQLFNVVGTISGKHEGTVKLADDFKTIIFQPNQPFIHGESVQVSLQSGLLTMSGKNCSGAEFEFLISKTDSSSPIILSAINDLISSEFVSSQKVTSPNILGSNYITVPSDFPQIHVTTPANEMDDGYIFASNFIPSSAGGNVGSYLLIIDNNGEPVYYQRIPETTSVTDFKKLDNGFLAYWEGGRYHILDSSYNEVKTITAGNGYTYIDLHDLLFLPNGHYIFMIYDPEVIDMSQIAPGGNQNAIVIGAVIQEIDTQGNVVFQWNSFDHIPITDTNRDLTTSRIDYVHSNAIDLDKDGNILLSSRHLDEITKINRQTGDIIWRLGGKANQFAFSTAPGISDTPYFYMQHDIRRLPNGDISLFDNHNDHTPMNSRALEFSLDEQNKTATLVWEYRNDPDVFSGFMGNVQHLPNGNILIGWGGVSSPNVTEIKPDGTKLFEMGFDSPYVNYRAFRFPWHGYPTWAPVLVLQSAEGSVTLTFSWNGATDVSKYWVYGGNSPDSLSFISEVQKTHFEDSIVLTGSEAGYCYYQVRPVNLVGNPYPIDKYSNIAQNMCNYTYLPLILSSTQ